MESKVSDLCHFRSIVQ